MGCSLVYEDVDTASSATRLDDEVRRHLEEYRYAGIPAAVDRARAIATRAKATITPQAVVIDRAGAIRYRGRIDNFYAALGKPRQQVTERDLRNALDAVLSGTAGAEGRDRGTGVLHRRSRDSEEVIMRIRVLVGAVVGLGVVMALGSVTGFSQASGGRRGAPARAPSSSVTFTETIAPILYANCVTCHRPGEAAPFSLISYEDVAKRGDLIVEVTDRSTCRRGTPLTGTASSSASGG